MLFTMAKQNAIIKYERMNTLEFLHDKKDLATAICVHCNQCNHENNSDIFNIVGEVWNGFL